MIREKTTEDLRHMTDEEGLILQGCGGDLQEWVDGKLSFAQDYPFLLCSVLEGDGIVNSHPVKKGNHFILPKDFGEVEMQGAMSLILSTVQA